MPADEGVRAPAPLPWLGHGCVAPALLRVFIEQPAGFCCLKSTRLDIRGESMP